MSEKFCKGGCGKQLPVSNKSGFAWGHSNGCPENPPSNPEAITAEDEDSEYVPEVQINLTEDQLNRIWNTLPLEEKGLAIHTALRAERE